MQLEETELYKSKIAPILANETVANSFGFKAMAELSNGRAAMLGFATGALAEIFGAGPIVKHFAAAPLTVLIVLAATTVRYSVIPESNAQATSQASSPFHRPPPSSRSTRPPGDSTWRP